ncbi:11222_t:CDS:2, partial [Funneliformis caledonium]
ILIVIVGAAESSREYPLGRLLCELWKDIEITSYTALTATMTPHHSHSVLIGNARFLSLQHQIFISRCNDDYQGIRKFDLEEPPYWWLCRDELLTAWASPNGKAQIIQSLQFEDGIDHSPELAAAELGNAFYCNICGSYPVDNSCSDY